MDDGGIMFYQTVQQEEEFILECEFEKRQRDEMDAMDI